MSEKELKVGDRVRFKKFCINHDDEVRVAEGDYGMVVSVDNFGIGVDLDVPQYISVKATDVELVEPADPKTAFLQELSELLRKYDAKIHDAEYYYIGFEIGASSNNSQTIHYELSNTDELCITPDNIMNFEKD